jgi:hypothetical protein
VTGLVAPTRDQKREALDEALRSRTLARSEQLKSFLRYVCEAEMEGRAEQVTEYVIGVEVLGRPEGYSPSEDSSVRTRAYELRHKLEKLYALEAPAASVRIVLPKGSYSPQFVCQAPAMEPVPVALPAPEPPVTSALPRRSPLLIAVGFIAAAALGSALTLLLGRAGTDQIEEVIRAAWGPLAQPDANVLLCAATPLHLVVTPEGHETFGSRIYPAPEEAYPRFRQHRPLAPDAKLSLVFTDNVLGVGIMKAVNTASNTLTAMAVSHQILPERVAPISAFRGRNVMLFGAPVDSDAITRVLANTPLTVDYEPAIREFVIRDRDKARALPPRKDAHGDFTEVYGLLTFIQSSESDGRQTATVAFSGITSAGAHGAAEFFASGPAMRDLRSRLGGQFPRAYQVVVKCTFSNMLLLSYEYDSHRIIRPQ